MKSSITLASVRTTLLFGVLFTAALAALPAAPPALAAHHKEKAAPVIPEPTTYTTKKRVVFNGTALQYTVRAGETYLRDASEKPTAAMFSFDYLAADRVATERPVTFVWNGGPGSASLWLHMGSLGPKRVVVPSNAKHAGPPPCPIVDASETVLDVTDLVFVDPVGTGYYHGRVDAGSLSLEEWVAAARNFATAELLPGLWRGNTLSAGDRARLRDGLVRFTGLSSAYVERAKLRVDGESFAKELLRSEGLAIGRNDARYVMDPVDDLGASVEGDATDNAISGAYMAALLTYLRDDLAVDWHRPYLSPADPRLEEEWNWNPEGRGESWEPHWVDTTPDLVAALEVNPGLRVMVASGYYDLMTPLFDAEYTLNRYGIEADRIDYRYYRGGHMMYLNNDERLAFLDDLRSFINDQLRD